MYIVGRHQSRTQCKLEQMMTNNQDVELQVLPDLEQYVVLDDPVSSTVAAIVSILFQGPPQDQKRGRSIIEHG